MPVKSPPKPKKVVKTTETGLKNPASPLGRSAKKIKTPPVDKTSEKLKVGETIDLVFSFDTTGSMYPCLTQVRRNVQNTVRSLFNQIPQLRIGIISHGDYCDGTQTITSLDLTDDCEAICRFVEKAPATGGGDADECYELALNHARTFSWTSGRNKAVVLIGDCGPHEKGYRYGSKVNDLDWKNELGLLIEAGIKVYPIQALGRSHYNGFYDTLARRSEVPKLTLPQFADIEDIVCALCFNQAGMISQFEETLRTREKRPSFHVTRTISILTGKSLSEKERSVTLGSRFQVLELDSDCEIREFVRSQGLEFKKGRGFYQFTKSVKVQDYKEVIAQNVETGEILYGSAARKALGIPEGTVQVYPKDKKTAKFIGFIQSTSVNRKLLAGTKFLYEISETEGLSDAA